MTCGGFIRKARSFWRESRGVAAVEFALIGPLIVFGLLAMTDIGRAVHQRMSLDHVLRAGAQLAAQDPGVPAVRAVLEATASGDAAGLQGGSGVSFTVERVCACAEAPVIRVACTTTCAAFRPTSIFYVLSSDLTTAGLILPAMRLQPAMTVQIR